MNGFDNREKGFEAKYSLDQETRFKVTARRDRLLGEWAAGEMGLGAGDVAAYAKDVVSSNFERPGDDDVVEKVLGDFEARGISISEQDLRAKMDELGALAHQQITEGKS